MRGRSTVSSKPTQSQIDDLWYLFRLIASACPILSNVPNRKLRSSVARFDNVPRMPLSRDKVGASAKEAPAASFRS
jgi:hypothetical protein